MPYPCASGRISGARTYLLPSCARAPQNMANKVMGAVMALQLRMTTVRVPRMYLADRPAHNRTLIDDLVHRRTRSNAHAHLPTNTPTKRGTSKIEFCVYRLHIHTIFRTFLMKSIVSRRRKSLLNPSPSDLISRLRTRPIEVGTRERS